MKDEFYAGIQQRLHSKDWNLQISQKVINEYEREKALPVFKSSFFLKPAMVASFLLIIAIGIFFIFSTALPDNSDEVITYWVSEIEPIQNLVNLIQ